MKSQYAMWGGVLAFAAVVIAVGYSFTSHPSHAFVPVMRGELVREASASGKVEPPTQIDLYFKNSGRLIARNVKIGDIATEGQVLARQDTRQLEAQLREMEAGVDVQTARLAQLLSGTSAEDVRVAETVVANAEQSLKDTKESAIKAMQDAYTKADDAVRTKADVIFTDPRSVDPQISFVVSSQLVELNVELQRKVVEQSLQSWKTLVAGLGSGSDIAAKLQQSQKYLADVTLLLDYVAQALNAHVSSVSASTLDTWKASVSTTRTTINTSATALVTAGEDLKSAEGALASAQDALAVKKAPARATDIALYEAQIREAEARMGLIEAQIADTQLVAPSEATVTKVDGEVGEVVGPEAATLSLIPRGALQIKLNVSENNIADVRVGQKVRITLDAFNDGAEWQGTVIAIDPAETIVSGAVYYLTTVLFDTEDERVKSGMTANAWIRTAENDSTLFVPASAIEERDDGTYVYVLVGQNGEIVERRVETGIKGKQGTVEIISGVLEGEHVVVGEAL